METEPLRERLDCGNLQIMNDSSQASRKARDAEKAASRRRDQERLEAGEDPEKLQRENSIFPKDFFKNAKISNLSRAVGR